MQLGCTRRSLAGVSLICKLAALVGWLAVGTSRLTAFGAVRHGALGDGGLTPTRGCPVWLDRVGRLRGVCARGWGWGRSWGATAVVAGLWGRQWVPNLHRHDSTLRCRKLVE